MVAITRRSLTGGIIIAFLVLVAIVSIVPLMHEASISLSSENAVLRRDVGLFPTEFSLRSYQKVFADKSIRKQRHIYLNTRCPCQIKIAFMADRCKYLSQKICIGYIYLYFKENTPHCQGHLYLKKYVPILIPNS